MLIKIVFDDLHNRASFIPIGHNCDSNTVLGRSCDHGEPAAPPSIVLNHLEGESFESSSSDERDDEGSHVMPLVGVLHLTATVYTNAALRIRGRCDLDASAQSSLFHRCLGDDTLPGVGIAPPQQEGLEPSCLR